MKAETKRRVILTALRDYEYKLDAHYDGHPNAIEERDIARAAIDEVEHMQLLSHQWPVRASPNTLGAIEMLLDDNTNAATNAMVRGWLTCAWEDINGDTEAGATIRRDKTAAIEGMKQPAPSVPDDVREAIRYAIGYQANIQEELEGGSRKWLASLHKVQAWLDTLEANA